MHGYLLVHINTIHPIHTRPYVVIDHHSLRVLDNQITVKAVCHPSWAQRSLQVGNKWQRGDGCMSQFPQRRQLELPPGGKAASLNFYIGVGFLLPLERSCLGAAAAAVVVVVAAAAPPGATAQAPFSCSSPLLLVRLLFFPLLLFWLGIAQDSDVSVILDLYRRLLPTLSDISVDSISAVVLPFLSFLQCFLFVLLLLVSSWMIGRVYCSYDSSRYTI